MEKIQDDILNDLGDAPDEVSIVPIEGMTWAHERNGAPCPPRRTEPINMSR
jgi:hypothetical protein